MTEHRGSMAGPPGTDAHPAATQDGRGKPDRWVDEASAESFPASDPPGWSLAPTITRRVEPRSNTRSAAGQPKSG